MNVQSTLPNSNSLVDRKMFELQKIRITKIRVIKAFLLGDFRGT